MITKPVRTVERVINLALTKRSVVFGVGKIKKRLPAAVVQNWQARFLYNQIKNGRISEYITEEKIEKVVSRDLWRSIRTGDVIYSRKTMLPRRVLHATGSGSVKLQKVSGEGTTAYCDCDRANFVIMGDKREIPKIWEISLCRFGCGCMTHTVNGKCGKCGKVKND